MLGRGRDSGTASAVVGNKCSINTIARIAERRYLVANIGLPSNINWGRTLKVKGKASEAKPISSVVNSRRIKGDTSGRPTTH
jgi:hypothetical protein